MLRRMLIQSLFATALVTTGLVLTARSAEKPNSEPIRTHIRIPIDNSPMLDCCGRVGGQIERDADGRLQCYLGEDDEPGTWVRFVELQRCTSN